MKSAETPKTMTPAEMEFVKFFSGVFFPAQDVALQAKAEQDARDLVWFRNRQAEMRAEFPHILRVAA